MIAACTEDQPVKSAVDDISQRTSHDQRKAEDQTRMGGFLLKTVDIYGYDDDGNDPENAQDQFTRWTSESKPESHAFIFCEMKNEPVPGNVNFLANGHVRLDPDL